MRVRNIRISYAITCCNEHKELDKLLSILEKNKRKEDEISILIDITNKPPIELYEVISLYTENLDNNICAQETFLNKNFAVFKNELRYLCNGEYIVQIDVDEIPHEYLIQNMHIILESNPNVDVIKVPRINIVDGITNEHLRHWNWHINEKGWINWENGHDYQWRIYKNIESIKWERPVHEYLTGYKTIAELPAKEEYCLYHRKKIEKQEQQNNFYLTI